VVLTCSVRRTSTFILYFFMNSMILLERAGGGAWSPMPMIRTSIFGSRVGKRLRLSSLMSSKLFTFQDRTDLEIAKFIVN